MNFKSFYSFLCLTLFLFFLQPQKIFAQYIAHFIATVQDTAGQPLENVVVYAKNAYTDQQFQTDTVYTDGNGKCDLGFKSFPNGGIFSYAQITFEYQGYKTLKIIRVIRAGTNEGGLIILVSANSTNIARVTGSIKFEDGASVPLGKIFFYNTYTDKFYQDITDADGNYSIEIDKGIYRIESWVQYTVGDNWTYKYQCYANGADSGSCAMVAIFEDTDSIDFIYPNLNIGTISGTMTDAVTHEPIPNSYISVTNSEYNDSTFIGTDPNGNYTLSLFEGEYYLFAYEPGYLMQYYNNVFNLFNATPVKVAENSLNVTGIDFEMMQPEPGSNSISGSVFSDLENYGIGVYIYAIPLDGGNWIETKSGMNGFFSIPNLKNGEYILLFYKEGFLSEYYQNTVEWEKAAVINLTGGQRVDNISMVLYPLDQYGGEVKGKVSTGSAAPISGTLISAVNSSGETVSAGISTYNGTYMIPYLQNGSYKITASKIGYSTEDYFSNVLIDLNSNPNVGGVNFIIVPTGVEELENGVPKFYNLSQNFPNPFNPSTTIKFQIPKDGFVTLKIYDVLGKEIATLVNEEEASGNYKVDFNASQLSSGIYFYRIQAGEFSQTKKMILLR